MAADARARSARASRVARRRRGHRRVQSRERVARAARGLPAGGREPDQPRRAEPRRPHPAARSTASTRRARLTAAFDAAREAGFDNVSVDLIYGLPGLDLATWERTVADALGWEPDHFSAYALTLDEGSLWHAAGVTDLPDEDDDHRSVLGPHAPRARRGLRALRGLQLRATRAALRATTRSTGDAEEYLALGPGACGLPRRRALRQRQARRALLRPRRGRHGARRDTRGADAPASGMAERLILGLRLARRHPHRVARRARRARARRACPRCSPRGGSAASSSRTGGRVRLTEEGFLLSDALFVELL